jgi:hypothetical protein
MTEEPRQPGPDGMPPQPPASPPPGYGEPVTGFGQPVTGEPAYPVPGFGQPGTGDPAYAPPGEPGVGQSGFGQPGVGVPQPPTPPAPGYGGQGLQGFDPKSVDPLDWGIIAAGVVALVFSTFNFFTYKVEIAGFSTSKASVSAWHGGLAPLAILLAVAAAVLLAVEVIAKVRLAFPVRLVVLGAFALATLLLLLALFVVPGNTGGSAAGAFGIKINKGHGIGYWLSLLAVLAGTALSFKRFTDTGGKLPVRR